MHSGETQGGMRANRVRAFECVCGVSVRMWGRVRARRLQGGRGKARFASFTYIRTQMSTFARCLCREPSRHRHAAQRQRNCRCCLLFTQACCNLQPSLQPSRSRFCCRIRCNPHSMHRQSTGGRSAVPLAASGTHSQPIHGLSPSPSLSIAYHRAPAYP